MNGRQAARAAAARIAELEYANGRYSADVREYNQCILHMISHGSPCDYCQDRDECREAGKDMTIGCDEWMLAYGSGTAEIIPDGKEAGPVEIEGILPESETGGAGAEADQGESETL